MQVQMEVKMLTGSLHFLKNISWSLASVLTATSIGATLLVSGCPPPPPPPGPAVTPTPSSTLALNCPTLGPTIPRQGCPGVRLENVTFTCAASGNIPYSITTAAGGAQRYTATLADGSVITATGIPIDGRCFDGIPVKVGVTLGLVYTADQGVENAGPSTGLPCVTQSKANFTQFITNDPLLNLPGVQQAVKDLIHGQLDTKLIEALFRPTSAASPARCARWRQMP